MASDCDHDEGHELEINFVVDMLSRHIVFSILKTLLRSPHR